MVTKQCFVDAQQLQNAALPVCYFTVKSLTVPMFFSHLFFKHSIVRDIQENSFCVLFTMCQADVIATIIIFLRSLLLCVCAIFHQSPPSSKQSLYRQSREVVLRTTVQSSCDLHLSVTHCSVLFG